MPSVLTVTVRDSSLKIGPVEKPCWNVEILRAERDRLTTTTTTMVVRQFVVDNEDQFTNRLSMAAQFAESLGKMIGAKKISCPNVTHPAEEEA